MSRGKATVVVGAFETKTAAQECVDELVEAGFKRESIGVITRDEEKGQAGGIGSKWEEGAAVGVATGAGAGALWALGIAAGVLPAIGPVIAGGLLASVLASAAGGAAIAGLVGALVGLGLSEEDARYYDERFREGKAIVTVRPGNRRADAARIIVRNAGRDRARAEGHAEGAPGRPIEVRREPRRRRGGRRGPAR
ncbi:MAG: hypothetical protein U0797_17135 [Gemmataceae bacterium]